MPVTAKFSKEFYDRLGHGVADELVEWFNAVDVAYRSDFRELFEVHFARFDAKLEQRVAEVKVDLEKQMASLDTRLVEKMAALETRLVEKMAALKTRLTERIARLETRVIRWMFVFWIGTIGIVATLLGVTG